MSSFCSAYSGEPFNYTTVARGSLIYFLVDANIVALLRSPGHCRQQTDNSWIDSAWTVGQLLIFNCGTLKLIYWQMEMINGVEDYQGFWDRFLLTPGATVCNMDQNSQKINPCFFTQDYSVEFDEKLRPLSDEEKFDVDRFLKLINEHHKERRTYRPTAEAIDALKQIKRELDGIDAASGFG